MQSEDLELGLKEDTVDVDFTVRVADSRLPGVIVINDSGSSVFAVFYTKRSGFSKKPKMFLIDSFSVAVGSRRLSYEEAIGSAKQFFDRYLRSRVLQRAYAAKIVNL